MLVRECGLFAENRGGPGEVLSQTYTDLPRAVLWLPQIPLVLTPLGRMGYRDELFNRVVRDSKRRRGKETGRNVCPSPHLKKIPGYFFGAQIERRKPLCLVVHAVLCLACGWLR